MDSFSKMDQFPWIGVVVPIRYLRLIDCYRISSVILMNLYAWSLFLLSGCAVGPDFVIPASPTVTRYTNSPTNQIDSIGSENQLQHVNMSNDVREKWWTLFKSPQIDLLVQQALLANPTIKASNATLRQSQNNLRAGYGIFFPRIDLDAAASRNRSAPIKTGLANNSSIYNLVTVDGSIGYSLDIFGGERRTIEGLQAQTEFQRNVTVAAYLALTANVVNTSIARSAYQSQIRLTEQLIAIEMEQLVAYKAQFKAGTAPYSNVLLIQSEIAVNKSSLAPLKQKYAQSEHLLAILEGVMPADANLVKIEFNDITLPSNLPLSLPSNLVRQRPDILQAEAQLHAASANIGVATAAMFPSISLSANYGAAGTTVNNLSLPSGRFWSFGPTISIPIFQGGTLWFQRKAAIWFQRKAAIDAFDAAQSNYQQSVLMAFSQVADILNGLEHDAENSQAQSEALSTAQENKRLVLINYTAGLVAYLDVLAADVQLHQIQINYLQAVVQRYQDTVALYMALGGGWWNADKTAELDERL